MVTRLNTVLVSSLLCQLFNIFHIVVLFVLARYNNKKVSTKHISNLQNLCDIEK